MDEPPINLMVALGVGLLIGVERERAQQDKTEGARAAGIRTFSVVALAGGVAELAGGMPLLLALTLLVGVLATVSYLRTAAESGPGLTTEFALLLTALLGGLAMNHPAEAGSVGVVAALLLASRERLHRFAGSVLTEEEVRSALILAAAAVVILPLLPNEPMGPFGALNPWKIWRVVVLVLAIEAAGYLATRILGPRFGLPIAGLASGFVSSSATIGAMGAKAAKSPRDLSAATAGAALSTVATVIQMAVVLGATDQATLRAMTMPLLAAGVVATLYGAAFTVRATRASDEPTQDAGNPLSIKTALIFAATLSVVMLVSAAAREWFGQAGVIAATALAGLVDTHAPAISMASLVASQHMGPQEAVWPVLAALTTNSITKIVLATTSGGRAFAMRVVPGVILVAAAAWAGALVPGLAG